MTTTAQAIPALEVSAPDDNMDVLSDTGFDFGDGDIDLDLDTAPLVQDDNMSLNDAATDGGFDMQELPADQDDFMADHGDLIEEDDVYNDGGAAAVSQTVAESATTFEADMLAPPDEDLIDYSDDEAQQPVKMHSPSVHEEEDARVSFDVEATSVPADDHNEDIQTQEDAQPLEPIEAADDEMQTREDDVARTLERRDAGPENQLQDAELQREGDDEDYVHADDDGGVSLPADEHAHHDDDAAVEQQEEQQQDAGNDNESNHHDVQQIELRPVTVNYAGNELWLFKQHDLDESGDFLLEDLSVAKSSISDLFQACRLSLGDDVSGEHEIGFRFDHFHNLELYEDNTACVAVSLERLVDMYHTLQAQDGNDDPECFYITLQFRPRFATLLADVAQYAEQGSGYSALDAAVAAGETHFSNVFSSASTEHDHVEWDEEENEEEEASSPGSVHSIVPQEAEAGEPDEQQFEDVENREDEQEEDSSQNYAQHQQGVDLEGELNQALDAQDEESHTAQEAADLDLSESVAPGITLDHAEAAHEPESEAAERHASETKDERTPDQIAHEKQEAEDFVDYSDDEDAQEDKSVPAHVPSPSSSTVQGDEPTEIQVSGLAPEHDGQDEGNIVETGFDEHDDDATLLTQTQYGDDANHYAFQDYTETYDQGDPFQDFEADGTVGDPFEANDTFNGDTNQDFADYGFQNMDGEENLGFDEQPLDETNHGDHVDEAFGAVEDVTHADAFLDLDNAPEWAIDADPASNLPGEDAVLLHDDATAHEDEEGGAVEQPVATSSAADLALTSSYDHKPSSPQGQKRSIDEVGDEIDDAPDCTGMTLSSPCKRRLDADFCLPDAKRPRV
ncbi:hypothetical protein BU25DRAFT_209810 [Macroventuria anomochaeta]|uniref:Uncharacterized protein n=1 Tax=Macroventuria anomochaeta TaxID=301207 RepID=A0ACB6RMW6_9PLEO|nr:uncharacterized protein BU25DRAFT_209810 [Macroventuria anomochaeta]KAF2622499.1 hypothetical protein BU25DRAFT_209810 [Macroventuria anomochaeta]